MSCKVTVLYPNDSDISFDMEYYLASHMPLVHQIWSKHGLQSWDVVQFGPTPDGSKPAYHVQATLTFTSAAALQVAMDDADTKSIFEDVPKFTNKQPVFMAGNVVGNA